MPAGRPNKFQSVSKLQDQIDSYFKACQVKRAVMSGAEVTIDEEILTSLNEVTEDAHPTITGLALALDTTRDVLIDYENDENKKQFSNTIKKAKLRVESYNEQRLFGNNVTGVIFNLKNNFDWKDVSQKELSGPGGTPVQVEGSERPKISKDEWLKLHGIT